VIHHAPLLRYNRQKLPAQRSRHHCRKRGQKQEEQIQVRRTFDRRTGELNGSLSGSARFISLLTVMENPRFSPRTAMLLFFSFDPDMKIDYQSCIAEFAAVGCASALYREAAKSLQRKST
jgi:hypothetical protein